MSSIGDTAGPLALALRELPEDEREGVKAQLEEPFASFAADGAYELPGVSLTALAR